MPSTRILVLLASLVCFEASAHDEECFHNSQQKGQKVSPPFLITITQEIKDPETLETVFADGTKWFRIHEFSGTATEGENVIHNVTNMDQLNDVFDIPYPTEKERQVEVSFNGNDVCVTTRTLRDVQFNMSDPTVVNTTWFACSSICTPVVGEEFDFAKQTSTPRGFGNGIPAHAKMYSRGYLWDADFMGKFYHPLYEMNVYMGPGLENGAQNCKLEGILMVIGGIIAMLVK